MTQIIQINTPDLEMLSVIIHTIRVIRVLSFLAEGVGKALNFGYL